MSEPVAMILGYHDTPGGNKSEFESMAKILGLNGYKSIVPHTLFEGYDDNTLKEDDAVRVIAMEMLCEASCVVTMKDWNMIQLNLDLVQVARICKIPVKPFTNFIAESGLNG